MFSSEKLKDMEGALRKCVKCGMCQSVCPVYQVDGGESSFARGKLSLLKSIVDEGLPVDKYTVDALNRCAACASCQGQCKNGVEYIRILTAARREAIRLKGMPFVKKAALDVLSADDGAEITGQIANLQKVLESKLPDDSGLRLKIPIPGVGKGLHIPIFSSESFIKSFSGIHRAEKEWTKVGFFVGCSSSFILPGIAESILKYLNLNGVTVVIPDNQVCCGTPHYLSGDSKTANRLLQQNEAAFAKYDIDAVITGCPTCSGGLKEAYNIRNAGGKEVPVYEFSEFVFENKESFSIERATLDFQVTWHDPCHLARLQGIRRQPRQLLKEKAGENFQEMEKPDSCCGFGGLFSVSNPKTSIKVAEKKSQRIKRSGAEMVVTECPGCVLYLRIGAALAGENYSVMHLAEFLLKHTRNFLMRRNSP